MAADDLTKELLDLDFGGGQRFAAGGRGAIQPSYGTAHTLGRRFQIAFALQAVQQWVEGAGAHRVPMPGQFFRHLEAENCFLRGVVQDVQPDKAGIEIAIGVWLIQTRTP